MAGVDVTGTPARSPFGARTRVRYRDRPMTRSCCPPRRIHLERRRPLAGPGRPTPQRSGSQPGRRGRCGWGPSTPSSPRPAAGRRHRGHPGPAPRGGSRGHRVAAARARRRPLSGLTRAEVHARFPGLLADDPTGFEPGPDGDHAGPTDGSPTTTCGIGSTSRPPLARLVPDGDVLAVSHGGVVYAGAATGCPGPAPAVQPRRRCTWR